MLGLSTACHKARPSLSLTVAQPLLSLENTPLPPTCLQTQLRSCSSYSISPSRGSRLCTKLPLHLGSCGSKGFASSSACHKRQQPLSPASSSPPLLIGLYCKDQPLIFCSLCCGRLKARQLLIPTPCPTRNGAGFLCQLCTYSLKQQPPFPSRTYTLLGGTAQTAQPNPPTPDHDKALLSCLLLERIPVLHKGSAETQNSRAAERQFCSFAEC